MCLKNAHCVSSVSHVKCTCTPPCPDLENTIQFKSPQGPKSSFRHFFSSIEFTASIFQLVQNVLQRFLVWPREVWVLARSRIAILRARPRRARAVYRSADPWRCR